MRKSSVSSSNSLGTFLSPGVPNYRENGAFNHKGWSSERVPHPPNTSISNRRHIGSASALTTPFYSGRTLPSKWEDAERWICSPVALYPGGVGKSSSVHSQFAEKRRPKSKSGPIVPPAAAAIGCYYYSPAARQVMEAPPGSVRGLMVGSPFSTGVLGAGRVYGGNGGGGGDGHGWVDLVSSESSSPSSKEEKPDDTRESETMVSPVISRRDMATQMSPEATSPNQSPRERGASPHSYPSPLIVSVIESQHETPSSPEVKVREVKVDQQASMIKWSKRQGSRITKRAPPEVVGMYKNAASSASASSWDISEPAMSISKLQREEAKITAWENLQKAKAEAAIRKLEVKLEKKKSASMDKIMNKLQTAQLKAKEMRSSIPNKHGDQIPKNNSHKITSFRRHTFMSSLTSCFPHRIDCRSSFGF